MTQAHFGDPCIHCGIAHDDVPLEPCAGDRQKARVLAYCVSRQAWENPGSGCCIILCAMTNGEIRQEARHPSEHWAYNSWFRDAETLAPHEFRARYLRDARP